MRVWIGQLLTVVMGIGIAGTGIGTMHDAVHGSYSQKEWVNKMLGGTFYLLGSYALNWKVQHNILHHTYTNVDGRDEDIASHGPIRLPEHAPLRKIHRYQYIRAFLFYGFRTPFGHLTRRRHSTKNTTGQVNSFRTTWTWKNFRTRDRLINNTADPWSFKKDSPAKPTLLAHWRATHPIHLLSKQKSQSRPLKN